MPCTIYTLLASDDIVEECKFLNTKGDLSNVLIEALRLKSGSDLKCVHNPPYKHGRDICPMIMYNKNTDAKKNEFIDYIRRKVKIDGIEKKRVTIRGPVLILNGVFYKQKFTQFASLDAITESAIREEVVVGDEEEDDIEEFSSEDGGGEKNIEDWDPIESFSGDEESVEI